MRFLSKTKKQKNSTPMKETGERKKRHAANISLNEFSASHRLKSGGKVI